MDERKEDRQCDVPGTLELCGVEVSCVIGEQPFEREKEQRLVLDVALTLDFSAVAASDQLADTVDYVEVLEKIRQTLQAGRCQMLESAAERVARVCLEDPRIREVHVRIEKLGIIPGLRAAAVKIARRR